MKFIDCSRRVRMCAAGATLAAMGAGGCAVDFRSDDYRVREEKSFVVSGAATPDVYLSTFDGSIDVRAWDRPGIRVQIEKAGRARELVDAIKVKSSQQGPRIEVQAVAPTSGDWMSGLIPKGLQARIEATVPRRCALTIRSGDGTINVEGIDGPIGIETNDGSVRGIALAGDVRVRTGDGSIKLEPVDGRVWADTGDGAIVLGGRVLGLSARTGDGSISIRLDPGSKADRDWEIETLDGGIALELPEAFAADIDASTGDGVVRAERALGLPADERPGSMIRGRLGAGGRLIKIHTGDGSISLRRP